MEFRGRLIKVEAVPGNELSSELHFGVWARNSSSDKWIMVEHFHGPSTSQPKQDAKEFAQSLWDNPSERKRYINMALD
jgi:hypothetical protein